MSLFSDSVSGKSALTVCVAVSRKVVVGSSWWEQPAAGSLAKLPGVWFPVKPRPGQGSKAIPLPKSVLFCLLSSRAQQQKDSPPCRHGNKPPGRKLTVPLPGATETVSVPGQLSRAPLCLCRAWSHHLITSGSGTAVDPACLGAFTGNAQMVPIHIFTFLLFMPTIVVPFFSSTLGN